MKTRKPATAATVYKDLERLGQIQAPVGVLTSAEISRYAVNIAACLFSTPTRNEVQSIFNYLNTRFRGKELRENTFRKNLLRLAGNKHLLGLDPNGLSGIDNLDSCIVADIKLLGVVPRQVSGAPVLKALVLTSPLAGMEVPVLIKSSTDIIRNCGVPLSVGISMIECSGFIVTGVLEAETLKLSGKVPLKLRDITTSQFAKRWNRNLTEQRELGNHIDCKKQIPCRVCTECIDTCPLAIFIGGKK